MIAPPDDYKVGYRRPPQETRWKKGQSGNPRRKPKRTESMVDMVDRLLIRESPPLAGISTNIRGGFFERRTAWLTWEDSNRHIPI
jgi:hypothetical protein